ncbi:kinesin-like protein KIF9 [Zophobas morio]|uniref:kinesin-like protein KIF9 n=1 Tax=Zophobas morio TaxID=2755281 RepID=UPI0030834161
MKSTMAERKYTKIYFRIFPMEKMLWDYLKILDDHRTIYIRCLQQLAKSKEHMMPTFWTFRTDSVFFQNTQKQIYDGVMPEVLDNVSQGHDAVVMAYGQTGSGKSLTISDLHNRYEDRGILPRVASDLLHMKAEATKNNMKVCIQVSYAEFSRSTVNDLLKPCPNHLHNLKDIVKIKAKTVEDAFKAIFKGEGRKTFSENSRYPSHSCSSIFTFHIHMKKLEMQENAIRKCKLHVIDLAGADSIGNFSCLFKNPQEVGAGNLAKTQLEQFFLVLCSNIPEHIRIKQRLNPMIQYLGDSLKKATIFRFVGHIRVSREDLLVTISMLRFGELIGGLKATKYELRVDKAVKHEQVIDLQKQLTKLKLENKYNAILMHQDLAKSLSGERFAHIERTVNEYLQNKITQLTLLNVCDINIALEILKMICKKFEEEKTMERDSVVSATKPKRSSSGSNKVQQKSARSSHKSSMSDKMIKRTTDEKGTSDKVRPSSAKPSKEKVPSVHETASKRSKIASSTSLIKQQVAEKRRSSSRLSLRSNEALLMGHIPPESTEAWNLYTQERQDEYARLVEIYKTNEAAAKVAYKTYLKELGNLRGITCRVEKHRNDLFMAKMTREFQQAMGQEGARIVLSNYEKCVLKELQKSEQDQVDQQDLVLKCQVEVKTHVNICKEQKQALHDDFNAFCEAKYHAPVDVEPSEGMPLNIEDVLQEEDEEEVVKVCEVLETPEDLEAEAFEKFKELIEIEQRKKKLYEMKHRGWLTY